MNPLLFGPIFDILKQVLGGLGLDPEAKARAQAQAFDVLTNGSFDQKADQALALAQIEVNKTEAATPGIFKGGWRPGAGWICVFGLGVDFIVRPLLPWVLQVTTGHEIAPIPALDTATLLTLLGGLLGLGTLRTKERLEGKA